MGQFLTQLHNQLQLSSCTELQDCRHAHFADMTNTKYPGCLRILCLHIALVALSDDGYLIHGSCYLVLMLSNGKLFTGQLLGMRLNNLKEESTQVFWGKKVRLLFIEDFAFQYCHSKLQSSYLCVIKGKINLFGKERCRAVEEKQSIWGPGCQ